MTAAQAKQVLLLYRPGAADNVEPEMRQALELAGQDYELGRWFEEHRAFQKTVRKKLRDIQPPPHLKTLLLARCPAPALVVPPRAAWRVPVWASALAVAMLLLGLAALVFRSPRTDRFVHFQERMVSVALREYRMDMETDDMGQVRQFLAQSGGPADYLVPRGLQRLKLTGAGLLRWRNHPVSMVCFNRGDGQMLFLFVMNRSAVKDPPPARPRLEKISDLVTASWSAGDKSYVLAGPEDAAFADKYL